MSNPRAGGGALGSRDTIDAGQCPTEAFYTLWQRLGVVISRDRIPECFVLPESTFQVPRALQGILGFQHANLTLYERLGTRGPAGTPTPQQQKRHREAALLGEPHLTRQGRERRVWDHHHLVSQRRSRQRTCHPEDARRRGGAYNREQKPRECAKISHLLQPGSAGRFLLLSVYRAHAWRS